MMVQKYLRINKSYQYHQSIYK